jgi:hypothetical protein
MYKRSKKGLKESVLVNHSVLLLRLVNSRWWRFCALGESPQPYIRALRLRPQLQKGFFGAKKESQTFKT